MLEAYYLFKYLAAQAIGLLIAIAVGGYFFYRVSKQLHTAHRAWLLFVLGFGVFLLVYLPLGLPKIWHYPWFLTTYGPADGPELPLKNVVSFFTNLNDMERVSEIARDPAEVPAPITRREPATVKLALQAQEVIGTMADGVSFNYWTFDGQVPGPMLRVREGDTVEFTFSNSEHNVHHHSIDLHAVTGPGGGAVVTNVAPGESKTFSFQALNPGLFVYHCAHPNVATHMAHGMYGLILVEPEQGLPLVDREFYVMQGEFYNTGGLGKQGLQIFDAEKLMAETPEYIVFNGRVDGVTGRLNANTGETVRVFFGNGGVSRISSFHIIGEIFDTVYPEAAVGSQPHTNVQTTLVPAGGATITEFGLEVPGNYILVDHALSRLDRGAWGMLTVEGMPNPDVFKGVADPNAHGH